MDAPNNCSQGCGAPSAPTVTTVDTVGAVFLGLLALALLAALLRAQARIEALAFQVAQRA